VTRRREVKQVLLVPVALALFSTSACKKSFSLGTGSAPLPSGAVAVPSGFAFAPPVGPALPPSGAPGSFAELAQRADSAVVFVKTLQSRASAGGRQQIIGEGLGSAFVFDPQGLILTNNHVIEGASEIRVTFGKKREMPATVVGRDPPTDIAVLRVDASGLQHVPLGDSDAIRVGDWVVAIGNPFGLSHTVSAGIVSAKGRTSQDVRGLDESGYYDFLQTDASINPGNSGGPLIDTSGRVVGINTAIRAQANNIGFAVPINMVKELLPRLLKDGEIKRSFIGVTVASVASDEIQRLGVPTDQGALVRSVEPGSPADVAGIRPDDVIVGFENQLVPTPEHLRWAASVAGVGSTVSLRVVRSGRTFDLKLRLAGLPASAPRPAAPE
jgi:serine protease Do